MLMAMKLSLVNARPPGPANPDERVSRPVTPLSIEELETGLRMLGRGDVDHNEFWDANIAAFRQTVLFAIRETSDALLSPRISLSWRAELEGQLEALVEYIEIADRYVARRSGSGDRHRLN
jgi:hypothetical protein